MKDRSAKSIKSKMERILKPEKKKVLKNTETKKRKKKEKEKSSVNITTDNLINLQNGDSDDSSDENIAEENSIEEKEEKAKLESIKHSPKKKLKVLHSAGWHDMTDPNATTGVPYFVYKGAKHVLLFFRIALLGLKERLKLQIKEGVLSIISAHQAPPVPDLEIELKIKFSDPEQSTFKIKIDLVSRFGIDPRTCKIITFGGKETEKEFVGVLSEFPSNEAIIFNFEQFQGHSREDIDTN